jgi:hypothetical protein
VRERHTLLRGRLTSSRASQPPRRQTERSRKKFGKGFLADLNRAWRKQGLETLERLSEERPTIYFKAIAKLAEIQQRRLPEPPGFDRRRYREDLIERLQERVKAARAGSRWTASPQESVPRVAALHR